MRASALHNHSSALGDFADDLRPSDRVGRPLPSTGVTLLKRGVLLALVIGGGWAAYANQDTVVPLGRQIMAKVTATVSAALEARQGVPAASAPETLPPIETKRLAASIPTSAPPPASAMPQPAAPAVPEPDPAAKPPASEPAATAAAVEPLPPPIVDRSNPFQMRAEAAGLHPGLSSVLLASLTDADYRNAAHAVKTAIAETPDDGTFVWPRQRKPELALFQVKFVQGAAPTCRRYVVSVTKDRWLTTAPPMEKCGVPAVPARRVTEVKRQPLKAAPEKSVR